MIFVDYREGSQELILPLQKRGLPVEETTLEFGDVAFEGRGEGGKSVFIGIEYKKLPELIQSLRTERLQGHQMPGMQQTYEHAYLLIEGQVLTGTDGFLLQKSRRSYRLSPMPGHMTVMELLKRMHVLHLCGGLNPVWAQNQVETLTQIEALYRTWTDQDLDKHKSHLAIYRPPTLVALSSFRKVITGLPKISWKFSLAAQQRFKSLRRAMNASVEEWAALESTEGGKTRRLGSSTAERIVQEITKEYE